MKITVYKSTGQTIAIIDGRIAKEFLATVMKSTEQITLKSKKKAQMFVCEEGFAFFLRFSTDCGNVELKAYNEDFFVIE